MRKIILLISFVIIGMVIFAIIHSYSFSAITGKRSNDAVAVIIDGKKLTKDKSEKIISEMNCNRYHMYFGDSGNTAVLKYEFYDKQGIHLFDVLDMGNRNIIKVVIDKKSRYYTVQNKKETKSYE